METLNQESFRGGNKKLWSHVTLTELFYSEELDWWIVINQVITLLNSTLLHCISHWSEFTCIQWQSIHHFCYLSSTFASNNTFTNFLYAIFDALPINFQSGLFFLNTNELLVNIQIYLTVVLHNKPMHQCRINVKMFSEFILHSSFLLHSTYFLLFCVSCSSLNLESKDVARSHDKDEEISKSTLSLEQVLC